MGEETGESRKSRNTHGEGTAVLSYSGRKKGPGVGKPAGAEPSIFWNFLSQGTEGEVEGKVHIAGQTSVRPGA